MPPAPRLRLWLLFKASSPTLPPFSHFSSLPSLILQNPSLTTDPSETCPCCKCPARHQYVVFNKRWWVKPRSFVWFPDAHVFTSSCHSECLVDAKLQTGVQIGFDINSSSDKSCCFQCTFSLWFVTVVVFRLFVLLPPRKPPWGFAPRAGKSTLHSSWWIVKSELNHRGLFLGFTRLDEHNMPTSWPSSGRAV